MMFEGKDLKTNQAVRRGALYELKYDKTSISVIIQDPGSLSFHRSRLLLNNGNRKLG